MQLQGKWEEASNSDRPNKFHVSWECVQEAVEVVNKAADTALGKHFGIIAIAGGGLIPASMIARLRPFIPDIQILVGKHYAAEGVCASHAIITYNRSPELILDRKYLVVDDIYDSGKTIKAVFEVLRQLDPDSKVLARGHTISGCLFWRKQTREEAPTFYGCEVPDDRWLVFPWEPGWMQVGKVEDAVLTPLTPLPDTTGKEVHSKADTTGDQIVRRNLTPADWDDIHHAINVAIRKAQLNINAAPGASRV
jgi:hypoxanthine phosphoribosyltransferase